MKYFFILCLLSTLSCSQTRTKILMGTYANITLKDKLLFIDSGFNIIKNVENSLSTYKKESIVSRLNRYKYARLDNYTYEALALAKKYYKQSDGYFNIAIGNITKNLYRFGQKFEFIPHPRLLKNSNSKFKSIVFNIFEARLNENIKLDFGGMGKGFAVDKVKEYYLRKGVDEAIVSLSGDIVCIGYCKVKVQNPFLQDSYIFSIDTKKNITSITTSGSYNRYIDTQKNNHLIDPKSKKAQDIFRSITLISLLSNADIDAYATAASVMPKHQAVKFLNSLNVGYILITHKKEIIVSANIDDFCSLSIIDNIEKKQDRYIYDHKIKNYK